MYWELYIYLTCLKDPVECFFKNKELNKFSLSYTDLKMPRPYKRFDQYSWSHQYKIRRLANGSSLNEQRVESSDSSDVGEQHDLAEVEQTQHNFDGISPNSDNDDQVIDPVSDNDESICSNQRISRTQSAENSTTSDTDGNSETEANNNMVNNADDEDQCMFEDIDSEDDDEMFNNEDINYQENDDEPLYEGARLSVAESLISILSLSLRCNMTGVQLTELLRIIELHCPLHNKCVTTLHKFKKYFSDSNTPLVRHFYCTGCTARLENGNCICTNCAEPSKLGYFIEVPIIPQIKALYARPDFIDRLQHRHNRIRHNLANFDDIYEGQVYTKLSQDGEILEDHRNISLTWYTDGISIYKSSKFSIWPLYLMINELPFEERTKKESIILAAMWCGEDKPIPNLLLDPLVSSIMELREGIDVKIPNTEIPLHVKGIIICGACDLPAKALFLNMNQYNGRFGCQKCKIEGQYLREYRVRVYPYEHLNLRTDEETRVHAQQALNTGIAVCGVKGPTVLSSIVYNNMTAITVDPMHCVFEGVVKKLMEFWFSSDFAQQPFSLMQYRNLVDRRLKSITPPSHVARLPRSISQHLSYWKAHEFQTWLYYYSIPCINDIMNERYFAHYLLLVLGISLLFQTSVSPQDIVIASQALHVYVLRFEPLYGLRYMSNNLHQLLHLPEAVRQFGPLWTTSCFPMEDLNGRLKNLVHGSNSAQLQICSTLAMFLQLTSLKNEKLVEGRPAYEYCKTLDSKYGRIKRHFISDSVYIVGKCTELREYPTEVLQILNETIEHVTRVFCYQKLLQKKVMYSTVEYTQSKRTNSSFAVYYGSSDEKRIGQIRRFVRIASCLCPALCHCVARNYAIVTPCVIENEYSTCIDDTVLSSVHTLVGFENGEQVIPIAKLESVCFYCEIGQARSYIIERVNKMEWE